MNASRPSLSQWRAQRAAKAERASKPKPSLAQWRAQRDAAAVPSNAAQQPPSPPNAVAQQAKQQRDGARAELERLLAQREARLDKALRERVAAFAGSDPVRRSRALDLVESLRSQVAPSKPTARAEGRVANQNAIVAEYERLRKVAPMAAAQFRLKNATAFENRGAK